MFIVVEGHDFVGKSTQVELLSDHLTLQGREVCHVRTPGSTPIAEELRKLALKSLGGEIITPQTRSLLMSACRLQTWANVIKPALAAGKIVIADRWLWSGYLYQVVGEGVDLDKWSVVNADLLLDGVLPDVTVILTASTEERMRRKATFLGAGNDTDLMEEMPDTTQLRIENAILEADRAALFTKRIIHIHQKDHSTVTEVFNELVTRLHENVFTE